MNKEVIIEMLDNKLLIMEELKQVQASIFNGEVKSIMLFIENQQQELEAYKNNIKSTFEVINTQMKNLSKEEAENLRIIKFNLIKGSCTFEDLKTEEDYKY